jgi:protocatechuate 3,4-dioxygenase, alpha subunit
VSSPVTADRTPTPGQTVGPFFHYALPFAGDRDLVAPGSPGAIRLYGTVRDGAGTPVPDALVEIWQADPAGQIPRRTGSLRRDGYSFTGFGRASTDREGEYTFTTLTPGPVAGSLPFFAVTVFARGLLDRLFTRAYLPLGDAAPDALLTSLAERAAALITVPDDGGLRFDITLQGGEETPFLAYPGPA